ncbi:MAG TPA: hypothetical protein VFW07_00990 [Parafilimonas sp.]|nr:hypothetical protein [Parafilimonas sp.]
MKLKYCLLAMLLLLLEAKALPVRPLSIGDRIPPLHLSNIVNAGYESSNTATWKSKLLVFDFMATTCKGCIMALPRLDSLQEKYKNKLQIFLVTYEDAPGVKAFLTRNHIGKQIHLPFITNDSLLCQYFPHTSLSHEVWINAEQRVIAITEGEYVNDKNIAKALAGGPVNWPLKMDLPLYDDANTFLTYYDADSLYFKPPVNSYYTFASGYINTRAVSFLFRKDSLRNIQRFCITNYPIVQMYLLAYDSIFLPHSHVQLHVNNRLRYVYEKDAEYLDVWNRQNRYCYETLLPLHMSKAAVQKKVIADLDGFFGVQASFKNQETNCFVLKDTATSKNNRNIADTTSAVTLYNLLYLLNNNRYGTPVLNESNVDTNLLLPLSGNESIAEINIVLAKYGLVFQKLIRNTPILTITETGTAE